MRSLDVAERAWLRAWLTDDHPLVSVMTLIAPLDDADWRLVLEGAKGFELSGRSPADIFEYLRNICAEV